MAMIIIFKNYYFWIIIKIWKKCNILNPFAFKNYGKIANQNLENIYVWFLAATIPVLGLERCIFDSNSEQSVIYCCYSNF